MNLKRLYINTAHKILRLWWFLRRPEGKGVKVVLRYGDEVLMVRHNYGHQFWTFPGGGVKKNEEYGDGGRREIKEELGVTVHELQRLGVYFSDYEYKRVTVECFVSEVETRDVTPDNFEIAMTGWFPLTDLPEERAPSVDKIIKLLYEAN